MDHVLPVSKFDLNNIDHIKFCYNWKNLRPLQTKKMYLKVIKLNIGNIFFKKLKLNIL